MAEGRRSERLDETPPAAQAPFVRGGPLKPIEGTLGHRGVTVRWLRGFYRYATANPHLTGPHATTKEVVDRVVKCDTEGSKCSYLELAGVPVARPDYFISHTWSQPFRHVVDCVCQRLEGNEDAAVWLDIFALCQHQNTDPAAAKQLLCDLKDLKGAVEGMEHTLVVVDPEATVFTRAWCLLEMHTAVMAGRSSDSEKDCGKLELLPYALGTDESATLSRLMYNVDVADSQSYLPEDRERILADIELTVGGREFNSVLKRAFAVALAGMVSRYASPSLGRAGMAQTSAMVLSDGGYYEEAEAMYNDALESQRTVLGETHPQVAVSLRSLAELMRRQDKDVEALQLYQEALGIQRSALGASDPACTSTLLRMAELQDGEEAEASAREALAICRKALGSDHPQVASCLIALDEVLPSQAKESEALCGEAVRINSQALGAEAPLTVYSKCRLCRTVAVWERRQGTLRTKVLDNFLRSDGAASRWAADVSSAEVLHKLAIFLVDSFAMFEEAVAVHRRSLAIKQRAYGLNHPQTADSLYHFALAIASCEDADEEEVVSALREAIRIQREALRPHHTSLATSLELLALYLRGGSNDPITPRDIEAAALRREVVDIVKLEFGDRHEEVGKAYHHLAMSLERLSQVEEAERTYCMALEILRECQEDIRSVLHNFADFLRNQGGRDEEAEKLSKEAESILSSDYDSDSEDDDSGDGNEK